MKRSFWVGPVLCVCLGLFGVGCGSSNRSPGSPYLHLNEIVPSNHHSCSDETGASPDWIELYNGSAEDINLEGYSVADDTDPLTDANRLSNVLVVPKGGVKVLWADHRPDLGPAHLPFKLNSGTEKILLYGPDNALLDRVDWSVADTDVSYARFPDGTGTFVMCAAPTCNAVNGAACAK